MSDFWSRRLGGGRAAPRQEVARPQYQPPQQPQQGPEPSLNPPGATHMRDTTGACPECGSGDYVQAPGMVKPRCYGCGYPVKHSTSGMVATDRKKATPARQLRESMEGGYAPQMIIGRIE